MDPQVLTTLGAAAASLLVAAAGYLRASRVDNATVRAHPDIDLLMELSARLKAVTAQRDAAVTELEAARKREIEEPRRRDDEKKGTTK